MKTPAICRSGRSPMVESLENRTLLSGYTASLVAPLPTRTDLNFNPYSSPLVRDSATGTLYGFDSSGGANQTGIVFSVNPSTKALTTIATMQATGPQVLQQIKIDSSGNLFLLSLVSTATGGTFENDFAELFELPASDYSTPVVLYKFATTSFSVAPYGYDPVAMLIDSSNNIDVLTGSGGANNGGLVDQFEPSENYTTPHVMGSMPNDYHEGVTSFTQAPSGTFFITTVYGGANSSGGLYALSYTSSTATLVGSFDGPHTGATPGGLMYANAQGDIFGTVEASGTGGYGGVWEYNSTTQQLSLIAPFSGGSTGFDAISGVVADSAGNLYGTTVQGGSGGTFFIVNAATDAVNFTNITSTTLGTEPFAAPFLDGNGNFFVTTIYGSTNSAGAVVEITPGGGGGGGGGTTTGTGTLTATASTSTVPATAVSGIKLKGAAVSFTVKNSGTGTSKGKDTVTLYASTDGTIDSSSVPVGKISKGITLKSGKTGGFKVAVPVLNLPAGTYTLLGQTTDSTGATSATTTGPTVTVALPFVSIAGAVGAVTPATVALGKSLSFTLTLTNSGNVPSTGLATIEIGLATVPSTSNDFIAPFKKSLNLKVGVPLKLTLHLKIAKTFTSSGSYLPLISFSQGTSVFTAVGTIPFTIG